MSYILIVWMFYSPTNNGAGVAIHSAEFDDKASCYYAAERLKQNQSGMKSYCAKKSGVDWSPNVGVKND